LQISFNICWFGTSEPEMKINVACALALLGVAGCTTAVSPSASVADAMPVAAPAQSGFDGSYHGSSTKTASINRRCGAPGDRTFRVRDGSVVRRFGPGTTLQAQVQPDGSFATQTGRTRMSGTIQGGHMEVDLGSDSCAFHYTLNRV